MKTACLTANEVSAMLKVNVETAYRLIADEGLPATKVGRSWRFEIGAIRAWFHDRRLSRTPAPQAQGATVVAIEKRVMEIAQ
ncbi:MAG: helix-turn-helix domain-containing protein [Planctomycetes bacterium]|nr:helix-turn-helix domain-containing protein [Planctomycetota bacterium]